jgi:hypothetical protein
VFIASSERTFVTAINARGDVAGFFGDTTQADKSRGFVLDMSGDFIVFDPPNASSTVPLSINDRGEVAGSFNDMSDGGKRRGFLFWRNEKESEWRRDSR